MGCQGCHGRDAVFKRISDEAGDTEGDAVTLVVVGRRRFFVRLAAGKVDAKFKGGIQLSCRCGG